MLLSPGLLLLQVVVTDVRTAKSNITFVMMCMFAGLLMTLASISCRSASADDIANQADGEADGEDHSKSLFQLAIAYILEEVLIEPKSTGKALHDDSNHLVAFEHEVQHLLSAEMNCAQVMQQRGPPGKGLGRGKGEGG